MRIGPAPPWAERLEQDALRQLRRLERAAAAVSSADAGDAVHDVRVAARRLDAALDLWRPRLRPRARARARRILRRLRRRLGPVRELEVDAAALRDRLAGLPPATQGAAGGLLERLTRRAAAGRRRAERWCAPERLARIERRVARAFARPRAGADAGVLPAAWRRLETLASTARAALDAAAVSGDDAHLHEARIAVKRWRYALERWSTVAPRLDPTPPGTADRLAAIQEALGHLHDLQTLRRRVRRFSGRLADSPAGDPSGALEPLRARLEDERGPALALLLEGVAALGAVGAEPPLRGMARAVPGRGPLGR